MYSAKCVVACQASIAPCPDPVAMGEGAGFGSVEEEADAHSSCGDQSRRNVVPTAITSTPVIPSP